MAAKKTSRAKAKAPQAPGTKRRRGVSIRPTELLATDLADVSGVEGLQSLRLKVLDELLTHTTRIKVVRAAATLAQELGLPWAEMAKQHSQRIGGGARWIAVSKTGERLDFKKP